jgi:hypothetical protein
MTRAESILVFAVLAQMAWTILVGFWLGRVRSLAVKAKEIRGDVMLSQEGWPPRARAASNNFSNQFEVPVLFYVLTLLALHLHLAGMGFALLAVVFVASRVLHSVAHCSTNRLRWRGPAYLVGVAMVMAMVATLAVSIVAA